MVTASTTSFLFTSKWRTDEVNNAQSLTSETLLGGNKLHSVLDIQQGGINPFCPPVEGIITGTTPYFRERFSTCTT